MCNHTCARTLLRDLAIDPSPDVSAEVGLVPGVLCAGSVQAYRRHLREGVKVLYRSLPRTMVVLIPIADLTQVDTRPPSPCPWPGAGTVLATCSVSGCSLVCVPLLEHSSGKHRQGTSWDRDRLRV